MTEEWMRIHLLSLSVPNVSHLLLHEMTLLRSTTSRGEQAIHFDITDYELARQCFICILYCVDTDSTAVPDSDLSALRNTFKEDEEIVTDDEAALLSDERLVSPRVDAGAMLTFNGALPHKARSNKDAHTRIVVFALFRPQGMALDTKNARYPLGAPEEHV
jgi:ectoine hydroxylase-related dioxygenase (phytanoyl-CoA dioxygenase family)